ncbi:hypothetical protein GHJ48_06200 [Acinetobacter sp. dk771]|uniref:Uncharacterized protein n=1 Tax=Acinetobacter wanghuae TaxID=2662362 RepID=A0AA90W6A7_9GAMM|nr:hypothetical protein [Acinetobacter wanghuae]MQW91990.1 hypothetical protein [Acinetobacter wanghuae]
MAKQLEDLLMERSTESQNRILKNAKTILEDTYLTELAEKAKSEKTIKLTLDDLRARGHKNRA